MKKRITDIDTFIIEKGFSFLAGHNVNDTFKNPKIKETVDELKPELEKLGYEIDSILAADIDTDKQVVCSVRAKGGYYGSIFKDIFKKNKKTLEKIAKEVDGEVYGLDDGDFRIKINV
jgi:hypothetical protein